MSDYIKREDVLQAIENSPSFGTPGAIKIYRDETYLRIAKIPAADVAEVRRGKWEWFDEENGTPIDGYEREWGWRCSGCKMILPDDYDNPDITPEKNYCPNCGAKMHKEELPCLD